MAYQPIVTLPEREVVGYETLARFEGGQPPDAKFKEAWQQGRGVELETQAIKLAVEQFPHNINEAFLAINASAKTIIAMRGELAIDPGLEMPWPNLVIEISEKSEVEDYFLLDQCLSLLRQRQARIAVDDYGAGFSSLKHISLIDPDFIKIDRALIKDLGENSSKRSAVRAIVYYAKQERSAVIAEGIETEEELRWCAGLGVEYGQGYLFGRPEPFEGTSSKPGDSNITQ